MSALKNHHYYPGLTDNGIIINCYFIVCFETSDIRMLFFSSFCIIDVYEAACICSCHVGIVTKVMQQTYFYFYSRLALFHLVCLYVYTYIFFGHFLSQLNNFFRNIQYSRTFWTQRCGDAAVGVGSAVNGSDRWNKRRRVKEI